MKYLHTMIRVRDLDAALRFFRDGLGLRESRRMDNEAGKYTLVFLAAPGTPDAEIELTYNWNSDEDYGSARNFGHLAFRVDDIYATCERLQSMGYTIHRPPRDGHMAFVRSPDLISVELLQDGHLPPQGTLGLDAEHGYLVMAAEGTETSAELIAAGSRRYLPVYRPREVILERGQGARVWDREGRDYIDFAAGIAVCGLGHGDPDLVAALTRQAGRLWHTSNVFHSEPPLRLAAELVDASRFASRVFLCNSGAEANEAAIKLVRKRAAALGRAPERRVIVTFHGSFHGRTLAAVTATAQPKYQAGYEPLPGGFRHVGFNDVAQLEAAMAGGDVAAVMVEPVQGEGGVMPAAPGFLAAVRALCERHDALLVLDEIQCGMGRTGTLFAHWQDEVVPDVVTLAKALGGGFPIGALLAGPKVAETMQYGAHGTTFGGNPLAAAVARVALRKLASEEIAANVARQSAALRAGLAGLDAGLFGEVRGRGLMLGAVLGSGYAGRAGEILDHAAAHGLLLLQAGPDVLRFVPPLNITDAEIAEGLSRLHAALRAFRAA